LTVMLLGATPPGNGRDQRIASGVSLVARVRARASASQRKAAVVYSAACGSCFLWTTGYFARPSNKLRNARSRWRSAGWVGTLDPSLSHAASDSRLRMVRAAEVSAQLTRSLRS